MPASSEVTDLKSEAADQVPFVDVEEMPLFPGGDEALLKYTWLKTQHILKMPKRIISREKL